MATYEGDHRIDIESAWKYTVDADELIISTADATTDESEVRNHAAEDAITNSLGAAAAKATRGNFDRPRFHAVHTRPPAPTRSARRHRPHGCRNPADYRPADDAVVIGLSTSAPTGTADPTGSTSMSPSMLRDKAFRSQHCSLL
ncbi:hypothetical protein ACETU7_10710 [Rhodococcus sp. 3Y1]